MGGGIGYALSKSSRAIHQSCLRLAPKWLISNDHWTRFLLNDPNCWSAKQATEPDQDDPEVIPDAIIAFISMEPSQIRLFLIFNFDVHQNQVSCQLHSQIHSQLQEKNHKERYYDKRADRSRTDSITCIELAEQDDFPLKVHQLKKIKSIHPTLRVRKLGPFLE